MLSETTMTTPKGATLTEAELFGLLIDSPVLENATLSTLMQPNESKLSMTKSLFGSFQLFYLDDEQIESMVENLREQDDPAYKLEVAISDLENYVDGLRTLKREFKSLMAATLKMPKKTGNAENDVASYIQWERSPRRYVLPVSEALQGSQKH
jgi:hypothetical protein